LFLFQKLNFVAIEEALVMVKHKLLIIINSDNSLDIVLHLEQ